MIGIGMPIIARAMNAPPAIWHRDGFKREKSIIAKDSFSVARGTAG
jgi:hypothetical protein